MACRVGFCHAPRNPKFPSTCCEHGWLWMSSPERERCKDAEPPVPPAAQAAALVDFVHRLELEQLNGHPGGVLNCPCPKLPRRKPEPRR